MDKFEELKQKYQDALSTIKQEDVRLTHLNIQDNKLRAMLPTHQRYRK